MERLRPRTLGMTQNEQRLLQPSCTFRFGRVRDNGSSAANTGAAINSVWAKMSPIMVNAGPERATLSSDTKSLEIPEAISATRCLWELPTTQLTPGRVAI